MPAAFEFRFDALSAEDLSALRELADTVWDVRHEVVREWSRRLIEVAPEYFSAGGMSPEQVTALNEAFLSLVFNYIREGDAPGLYAAFYDMNRTLIEDDLRRAPAQRISLMNLYAAARISLRVIEEQVLGNRDRLVAVFSKLIAQLTMVAGRAYSDSREDYLQQMFEQVNTLSHELRTPLAHLVGYLEMLQAGDFGPVSPRQEEVIRELIHESDELVLLLTGTLDLSRLEAGRVAVWTEDFPLSAMLAEVVNITPNAGVRVTCAVAPDVPLLHSDRIKLKQIVGNLLRNALRYGAGHPVEITAVMRQPEAVEITVCDHGLGIKPEERNVIFDFFARGDASKLARDGYGIGLHVVRRLVALLGGNVEVLSSPGHGACFRVILPSRIAEPSP